MTGYIRFCLLLFFIIFVISSNSCSALTKEELEKRDKIEYAIEQAILNNYDIPFSTYVELEMWDKIDSILENTYKYKEKYRLPGLYYSRPYIVNDNVMVFDNTDTLERKIYVFKTNSLKLFKILQNKEFSRYEGGIRAVSENKIISGGSDRDVDTAVIWDINTDDVKTLKLKDGHYISTALIKDAKLYIGSCGGKINTWHLDNLKYWGTYSTSDQENTTWDIFNQQACINAVHLYDEQVIGVGEKQIFIWDMTTTALVKKYNKVFNNSIVYFYNDQLVEYKNNKFVIRNLSNGKILRGLKTKKIIDDLIVSSDLMSEHKAVLIISLRHNKGINLYDFETLNLIKKTNLKGETINACANNIFATDDHFLYKYNLNNQLQKQHKEFLKNIKLDNIKLTHDKYFKILKRSHNYPDIINTNELTAAFLKQNRLDIHHSFKYGKIGERLLQDQEIKEDIFGYKLVYEIQNSSETGLYINLRFKWSGEYGKRPKSDTQQLSHTEAFFIPPKNGRVNGIFNVGEKEPVKLLIYPDKIDKMPTGYYEELMTALSKENNDISIIDKYLNDERVKKWHQALQKKKDRLVRNKQIWPFNLIQ